MCDNIIKFENVKKIYYLYKNEKEQFSYLFKSKKNIKQHIALNNINFLVNKGESIGIIGKNGAGKSTILKMITGVTFPTEGKVTIIGNVAALLELTAGFVPEMTGRENIYLKSYLTGLSEDRIKEIEDDIVDFADLGEYIDQPIRTYSSGMKARLGFSININIKPDILVIDEALSVGDASFRKKCHEKIISLVESGVTVLYVSHSIDSVLEICTRVIYLKKGNIVYDGEVNKALKLYKNER